MKISNLPIERKIAFRFFSAQIGFGDCDATKYPRASIFILSIAYVTEKDAKAEEELVPPDGGWGWLVLLASVMVNLLIPGTVKSFGVLFVEFLEVFDASPAAAAWIPALCYFLYSSLGKDRPIIYLSALGRYSLQGEEKGTQNVSLSFFRSGTTSGAFFLFLLFFFLLFLTLPRRRARAIRDERSVHAFHSRFT